MSNNHHYPSAHLVAALVDFNRPADARAEYARLLETTSGRYASATNLAIAVAAMGDGDQALELAHQACDERDGSLLIMIRSFPNFGRVRALPRFAEVARRMRLP